MGRKPRKKKTSSKSSASDRSVPSGRSAVDGEPPELRVAKALFRRGDHDEALRQFRHVARLYPRNVKVLIDAARAHGHRYDLERSHQLLQRADQLAPRRPDVQFLIGETYRILGMTVPAQRAFEQVCSLLDDGNPAQLELAYLYERRHRLDAARQLVSRYLRVQPRSVAARILAGRVARRENRLEEAEASLRDVAADANAAPMRRAEAYGDLVLLLDQQGRYPEAWQANEAAKRIQLAHDQRDWAAAQIVFRRFGQLADSLGADSLATWPAPNGHSDMRVAWLTGFPRSGTTLLEQVLDAHPDITCSDEHDVLAREIFPRLSPEQSHETPVLSLLNQLDESRIAQARQRYQATIEGLHRKGWEATLHVDKNPALTLMIPVIFRLFPEARLVFALRDPRDVLVSCYLRYLPLNPVSVCFLTLDRLVDRYRLDLDAWLKYRDLFGERMLMTRYEDFIATPAVQAERTCQFLQVPWVPEMLDYRTSAAQKVVGSPTYEDVAKPIYATAVGRWRNYAEQLGPVLSRVEELVGQLGYL